jgi:hypothetical protein
MSDRKQINVKIKKQKAEKWEEYHQENPEYSSMTDLVRQSVEKEIAGNSDSPTDSTSPEVGKDLAQMKENMSELQRTVEMLTDTVSELRNDMRNQTPSDKHLRGEIFASLPIDGINPGQTPEEIANKLGEPINADIVSRVLEDLEAEVGSVKRSFGPEEGIVRYRKEE